MHKVVSCFTELKAEEWNRKAESQKLKAEGWKLKAESKCLNAESWRSGTFYILQCSRRSGWYCTKCTKQVWVYSKKSIQRALFRYDCTNCIPNLSIYMAKDSFSLHVQPRLCGLEEDSFPLPFTGATRPHKLSTLHSPPKRVSLAGLS